MDSTASASPGPAMEQLSRDTPPGLYKILVPSVILVATFGMGVLLPFENAFVRVQADYRPLDLSGQRTDKRPGAWAMLKRAWKQEGRLQGAYRGWLPMLLMGLEAIAIPLIIKAVEGNRFEWNTKQLSYPTMLLMGLPTAYLHMVMTRAVLSRYVSPTRTSARSIWSLPSRNVLAVDLCLTALHHAIMAFRTRYLFPLDEKNLFVVSLLSQGPAGVAKWAAWGAILAASLVITSPLVVARVRLIAQESSPQNVTSDVDPKAEPNALIRLRPSTLRPYTSPLDAIRTIYAEEGWQALFVTWRWSAMISATQLIS